MAKLAEAKDYDLRVLCRKDSSSPRNAVVRYVEVDYTSRDSLVAAIDGCDAVVNTLSVMASVEQHAVLDAVIEAQIPRYFPANWGWWPPATGSAISLLQAMPFMDTRRQINYRVETAAVEGKLTYTSLVGGAWLETFFQVPVMMSLPEGKFFIHRNPDAELSYTSKKMCAEALVGALKKPEETKNRHLEVELIRISQTKALELVRAALPGVEIEVVQSNYEERYGNSLEAMRTGAMSVEAHGGLLSKIFFDPDASHLSLRNDNELLGVKSASDEDFMHMVQAVER